MTERPVPTQHHGDQEHPPSRDGLGDAEVWEWTGERWQVRRIGAFEEGNPGGSPAPVEEP